jgi:hypothetical protein
LRRLFEFKCEDGHISEQLANDDVYTSTCRECDKPATRLISAVRVNLDPISGDFPKATNKWVKNREQRMKLERKAVDNHGSDAAWDIAKR